MRLPSSLLPLPRSRDLHASGDEDDGAAPDEVGGEGFGSEASLSLSPPSSCGSGSESSSAPSPALDPSPPTPTPPLGLNLWDVVVARVPTSSWGSVLARVAMVFSGCL